MSKITELKNGLYDLEDLIDAAIAKAKELSKLTDARCFSGQLKQYLIPTFQNFVDNGSQPGSIEALRNMLENDKEDYNCNDKDEE